MYLYKLINYKDLPEISREMSTHIYCEYPLHEIDRVFGPSVPCNVLCSRVVNWHYFTDEGTTYTWSGKYTIDSFTIFTVNVKLSYTQV